MAAVDVAAAATPARSGKASPLDHLAPLLWRYLRPQGWRVVLLALCLLGGVGLQVLAPQLTSRFIDLVARVRIAAPVAELWRLAGLFIAVTLAAQGAQLAGAYFSASVGWSAANRLREDLARHCLALDMAFHNARTPGELIERVDGDVSSLASVFSQFLFQIAGSAVLLAGILVVLSVQNLAIGAAMTLFAAAAFAVLYASRGLGMPLYRDERQARSDIAGFVEERIGGLDDIRANGGGAYVVRRLAEHNDVLTARGTKAIRVAAIYIVLIANGVFIAGSGLALCLGVWLFQRGQASLGEVYLLVQYTAMLRAPLEAIGTQIQDLQRTMASLGRVLELQALRPQVESGPGLTWSRPSPRLEFDRVSFAYGEGQPVLSEVSFRLEPGQALGLLGRTGSGKTTLTRLICRLYDPTAGEIRFDGAPIGQATLAQLHAHVGVVTQDVQLFQATIRDNLTFFDDRASDARLAAVLEDLGLGPWLSRQPAGLDSVLAGGGGLSAGEAQLLAFARVFLKAPGVVILDEASSRLDPVTERLINRATERLLGADDDSRRTTLIVAHRLSTVRRVDRIMILEHGRVAEQGPRAALAADPASHFAALLRTGLEEMLA